MSNDLPSKDLKLAWEVIHLPFSLRNELCKYIYQGLFNIASQTVKRTSQGAAPVAVKISLQMNQMNRGLSRNVAGWNNLQG